MCVPGCLQHLQRGLNRRGFLGAGAAATGAVLAAPRAMAQARSFSSIVDLTHTLSPEFPTYFGKPGLEIEDLYTYANDKLNLKIWTLNEHTGTHIDSPFHFSENGWTVDLIPSENLVSSRELLDRVLEDTEVVGIDEGQFFDAELPAVCNTLADQGRRVIVAGLDQDYLGKPFEPMPQLLAIAEYITKTLAICMVCGAPANHTQRLVANSERVLVGAQGTYEARCRQCFDPRLGR